jgi:hypothetical protein
MSNLLSFLNIIPIFFEKRKKIRHTKEDVNGHKFFICLLRATNGQMLLGGHSGGWWVGCVWKGGWLGGTFESRKKR